MRLVSTAGRSEAVDFRRALFDSLAPDGGLYTPDRLEPLADAAELRGRSLPAVARALAGHLLGDELGPEILDEVIRDALDFPTPLQPLEDDIFLLELFHGPTLAFKDVGARFMARLMQRCRERSDPLTVLVATSGDTGSAVAHAFLGLPDTRIAVLFPDGQVSALQERQFTTLGANVRALAVQGTFDDCQRLAKQAFADSELREGLQLTSANSINIGRLLPQIFYYVAAWAQLNGGAEELLFATPSGNFGNLTAGLMAKRLALPGARFVAATNANDVVPEYLRTGDYRPRPSLRTLSNAMDVGDPSNLERIVHLYDGDLDRLRADVAGASHDDHETVACLADVHRRTGVVLDPHTAVGYLGLRRVLAERPRPDAAILLATAHPAKFRETVEEATGVAVALPPRLEACLARQRKVTPIEPNLDALRKVLLGR
jgi:threonine synthase